MIRILIVDDSRTDRELLLGNMPEAVFKEAEFVEADTLKDAAHFLAYRQFNLLLLDLWGVHPGGDGIETYLEARRLVGVLPIIVLTGHDDDGLCYDLIAAGAHGYIVKGASEPMQVYRYIRAALACDSNALHLDQGEIETARRAESFIASLRKTTPIPGFASNDVDETATLTRGLATQLELSLRSVQRLGRMEWTLGRVFDNLTNILLDEERIRSKERRSALFEDSDDTSPTIRTQLTRTEERLKAELESTQQQLTRACKRSTSLSLILCFLVLLQFLLLTVISWHYVARG